MGLVVNKCSCVAEAIQVVHTTTRLPESQTDRPMEGVTYSGDSSPSLLVNYIVLGTGITTEFQGTHVSSAVASQHINCGIWRD